MELLYANSDNSIDYLNQTTITEINNQFDIILSEMENFISIDLVSVSG